MSLVIPPGYAQCSMELRNAADPQSWYVTFGVNTIGGDAVTETIGSVANEAYVNTFLESHSSSTTLVGCSVKVGQDGEAAIIGFVPSGAVGGVATAKLPQNCALLVTKNTGLGGRKNRGRMFIPNVLDENSVSNTGVIDTLSVAAFQGVADEFLDRLANPVSGDPGQPMVILHNGATVGAAGVPTPVSSLSVDSTISTQRRRLR